MSHDTQAGILRDPAAILRATGDAFVKLDPRRMILSPVMFTIEVGAVLTSALAVARLAGQPGPEHPAFVAAVAAGLWATVLFANFAEAMAEGRGRAQADALRRTRSDTLAKRLASPHREAAIDQTPSTQLRAGDHVLIEAGDIVPGDGEVVDGVAPVEESAITG
jgi:potassium-transporting ATPase ATP-binding subunit